VEALTPVHLLVLLVAVLVFWGHARLPEASRALGRSLRILRSELHASDPPGAPAAGAPADGAPAGGAPEGPAT
jgi:sec-independent protein translocase protein TatA